MPQPKILHQPVTYPVNSVISIPVVDIGPGTQTIFVVVRFFVRPFERPKSLFQGLLFQGKLRDLDREYHVLAASKRGIYTVVLTAWDNADVGLANFKDLVLNKKFSFTVG
jgi:hypothetical protein